MHKLKIYIDTSVIGGCFDKEFKTWSNSLINDFKNGIYIPIISEVVEAEISEAPKFVKEKYNEILKYNCEILRISEECLLLTNEYIKHNILPEKFYDDCLHFTYSTSNS